MMRKIAVVIFVSAVSAVTACSGGGSGSTTSAPAVTCANYAIHGSGKYTDEVLVRVSVSNTTSQPANYTVGVGLTLADPAGSAAPVTKVTITGLVAAKSSSELSRKVLTVSQVQHCQITGLSQS